MANAIASATRPRTPTIPMSSSPSSPPGSDSIDIGALRPPFAPKDEASRWFFGLQRLGIRPGLDSVRELLGRMGDPQADLDALVIAGTNGKGSAALALAAYARAAGLKTGLYTSPHLLDLRERIRIDGRMIPADAFAALLEEYRPLIEECRTTFFESLTALTLEWFRREEVELAVLETGLGGRLDATNVVRKAGLVLTSVGLDHQELLGHSLEAIAREKLGLAEADVPFYLDDLDDDLRQLAVETITSVGGEPVPIDGLEVPALASPPSVRGRLQQRQLARMLAVWNDLARRHAWPATHPERAFADCDFVGRYDVRGESPRLILDTAHNAHALCRVLEQFGREGERDRRIIVFASVHGKEIEPVLGQLTDVAASVLVCAPDWYRALPPESLRDRIRAAATAPASVEVLGSVREALERARSLRPESVLVTGSNFLVAEAMDRLGMDDLDGPAPSWSGDTALRRRPRNGEEAQ
jgi:folylpolyglutamate synthase/dihydrofolate synthase